MARQNLNLIEQHVEKLVVAIAAALFVFIIVTYVASSPNTIPLNGQPVGPGRIDEGVRLSAEKAVRDAVNWKAPDATEGIPEYPQRLEALAKGPIDTSDWLADTWPEATPPGPPVPNVLSPKAQGALELATIIAPDQPVVAAGRFSTILYDPHEIYTQVPDVQQQLKELDGPQDIQWVTVAARFDVVKQEHEFLKQEYDLHRFDLLVAGIELQRQRRLDNGEWSSWEDVDEYSEYYIPPPPTLDLVKEGQSWTIPDPQKEALVRWREDLKEWNKELVRPRLPEAFFGEDWYPPMVETIAQLYPDEEWPLPPEEPATTVRTGRPLSPRKKAELALTEARQLVDQGLLEEAYEKARKVSRDKTLPRSLQQEGEALRIEVDRLITAQLRQEIIEENQGREEESEDVRLEEQVYFAHDLSAEAGETYRYRMRVLMYNQYVAVPDRLKNPEDARLVVLQGEWSEPSEPILVPHMMEFWLTNVKAEKDQSFWDVYRWSKGEWVKEGFVVKPQEKIGEPRHVPHVLQNNNRLEVNFSTGAKLLSIFPEREYIRRTVEPNGNIQEEPPVITAAVQCEDEQGNPFERFLEGDRKDPLKRSIDKEMDDYRRSRRKSSRARSGGQPTPPSPPKPRGGGRGGGGG